MSNAPCPSRLAGLLLPLFILLAPAAGAPQHGEAFGYKTINTDTVGWLVARVSGRPLNELFSQRIWSRLGVEQDAYFTVDSIGTPYAGGGLTAGLRDMARLGQLTLDQGGVGDHQLFPASVVERIQRGGSKEAFAKAGYQALAGGSYTGMWWVSTTGTVPTQHGAFTAKPSTSTQPPAW